MNPTPIFSGPPCVSLLRRPTLLSVLATLTWLAAAQAADAPDASEFKTIDRTNFVCKYPTAWSEAVKDPDYKPESYFNLNAPGDKNSYVQFSIVDKAEDTSALLASTVKSLDGYAINALTKTKLEEWGTYKGSGLHLKGKILDTYPGGIKIFIFNSEHHNIMVVELYWSQELKDLQADLDFISKNFTMKN